MKRDAAIWFSIFLFSWHLSRDNNHLTSFYFWLNVLVTIGAILTSTLVLTLIPTFKHKRGAVVGDSVLTAK